MRIIRTAVGVLCLVLAAVGASIAQDAPPVVRFQLDNGLEVLLAPDRKVPKVGMSLIYRVGGMNEPAGRSGFAHLFEHLMFSGTAKYPRIADTYSALGISNNAFTEDDRTSYIADALASALPVLLSAEADRMANLGREVDQRELDLERDVVKNEMRQMVLDSAGRPAIEELRTALFPAPHPYAEAVIGSIADLDAAQLADVKAFFDAYYVPNNAILALSGDFDIETAMAQIADTFGRIPRGADVALPEAAVPQPAAVRLESTDRVPSPIVVLAVAGPPASSDESVALSLASDLLGNYEYGVLRHALINTGLATVADASWEHGRLGGRFLISASAASGVQPAALEAALRDAVATFAAGEFRPEDIERSRRSLRDRRWLGIEANLGRARALARRFDLWGEELANLGDDPVLLKLSADDVAAAFRRLAVLESMSVLTIVPGERGGYPRVLAESSGQAEPIVAKPRPPVDVPALAAGEPGRGALPPMETATLSNGIRLVHYRAEGAPRVFVAASAAGGTGSDRPGEEGLIELTATLMSRGAAERNFEAFSKAAKDIGADISGQAGMQAMVLAVVPEEFSRGVDLLADAVLRPRFEPAEWEALRAEVQQGLAYRKTDPGSLGYFAMEELIFPIEAERAALQPTPGTIAALTIEDVRALHQQLFTPKAMTIHSVGSIDLHTVKAELERAFGGWRNDGAGLTPRPHPSADFSSGLKVQVAPSVGNSQAIISLARPAPAFDDLGLMEAIAVARLLGGDANSRLNEVLRAEKGYSYGVNASVWSNIPTGGTLTLTAPVQADKVGASLIDIFAAFEGLATVPLTAAELTRTVMASASAQAGSAETSRGLFNLVMAAAGMGLTAEELNGRLDEIVGLQLPAVQQQAEALSSLENAVIVIAGDPETILPQLEEIGIEDAVVLSPDD
jgi:zinc protease